MLFQQNYCDDSYQVYICEKCIQKVETFLEFKENCSKNFMKLKGYVNQMKLNSNFAFHANLKVLLTDPKHGDSSTEAIEFMDMSQFLEAQIQTDEMEQEPPKECDKPPEIYDTPIPTPEMNTPNIMIMESKPLNNEQLFEISKFIYDNHFLNVPPADYNEVIEIASSPESFNDIPQNSVGSFYDEKSDEAPENQCCVCSKSFANPIQLSVHTFLHTLVTYPDNDASKSMKYYCALCTLDLSGLALIKKHLTLHTLDRISTCECCKQDFINTSDYNRHLALYPSHKQFVCEICECRFTSERKLKTHTKKKHLSSCMFCKSCFKTKPELEAHMKIKHNSKFCYICSTSFNSNDSLKIHLFDNHFELQTIGVRGNTQYNCKKCNAEFYTKYSLNEHLGGCVGTGIVIL